VATDFDGGGNLEVSPPVTVGSKEYLFGRVIYGAEGLYGPQAAIRQFLAAQGIQDPIEVDTTWLAIGHIDEVISFVPVNTARGFKMLIASPAAAQTILYILRSDGKGGLKLLEGKAGERTVNQILNDTGLMTFNDQKQAQIDTIRFWLCLELDLSDVDIIEVPVLFHYDPPSTKAMALTANLVNLLAVKNYHLIVPKPYGPNDGGTDEFEEYVLDQLNPIGLTVHFIDDWDWYHIFYGEVHCGTNARRFPDPTVHWWEQE